MEAYHKQPAGDLTPNHCEPTFHVLKAMSLHP